MFALERIRIIKNYLFENRQTDVRSLSSMLNVSEVTIRRDLEKLEKEGYLIRTHGGAVFNEDNSFAPLEIESSELKEAEEVAGFASQMIKDNDVILLSNGVVNRELSKKLHNRTGLTVLTNDISVAVEISGQDSNQVVLVGGYLDNDKVSLFGSLSIQNIENFHVKRAFLEIDGINASLELSVSSQEKAELIKASAESSEDSIILCRGSNFSRNAFYRLGFIDFSNKLIANPSIPDAFKTTIFSNNIQLFTSITAFEGRV